MPELEASDRKKNPTVQVYFDTEKGDQGEFRCYKIANLVKIASIIEYWSKVQRKEA